MADDTSLPDNTILQQERARFGNVSLYDIYTHPQYADIVKNLNIGEPNVKASPLLATALRNISLHEIITEKGALDFSSVQSALDKTLPAELNQMARQHQTLAQAMKQDSIIADYLGDQFHNLFNDGSSVPAVQYLSRNTSLSDVLDSKGSVSTDKLNERLANALHNVPLADLNKPEFAKLKLYFESELASQKIPDVTGERAQELITMDIGTYKNLTDPENPSLKIPGFKPVIGDILADNQLKINSSKLSNLSDISTEQLFSHALSHAQQAALRGVSVYDYIKNPHDSTGATAFEFDGLPLVTMLRDEKNVPPGVIEHLKHTSLAAVLPKDNYILAIDQDLLRDEIVKPLQDKKLADLAQFPDFASVVMGDEAAAITHISSRGHHKANDDNAYEAAQQLTLKPFISHGNNNVYYQAQKNVSDNYPPAERAADVISPDANAWQQYTAKDGTNVPYHFADNAFPTYGDQHVINPQTLRAEEQDTARYSLWRYTLGTKLNFTEEGSKLSTETNYGMALYKADLSTQPIAQNLTPGADGVTLNAFTPDHSGVAVVIDSSAPQVKDGKPVSKAEPKDKIDTYNHELAHALKLAHDFQSSNPQPGTVDENGVHKTPGITAVHTVVAYDHIVRDINKNHYFNDITPMTADYMAIREVYGDKPANPGDDTYRFQQAASTRDITANRDTHIVWVGKQPTDEYAQTIVDTGGVNTLDASKLGDKPISVTNIDLGKQGQVINMAFYSGSDVPPPSIYLGVVGQLQNGIISSGVLKGAPGTGTLETKIDGTLDGNGGEKTLIGGTGMTEFIGRPNHKDTIILHASPATAAYEDKFLDYNPAKDKIVAPDGTAKAVFDVIQPVGNDPKTHNVIHYPAETEIDFLDAQGKLLKHLLLNTEKGPVSRGQDLHIESIEGKTLPVACAQSAPDPLVKPETTIHDVGSWLNQAGGLDHVDIISKAPDRIAQRQKSLEVSKLP